MRFFPLPWISQFCEDVVVVLLPLLGQAAGRIVHGCCHPPLRGWHSYCWVRWLATTACVERWTALSGVRRVSHHPPDLIFFIFLHKEHSHFFYNFFAEMLTFSPKIVIFSINPDISSTNMRSALLLFRTLLANNAPARLSWYSSNQCNQYLCNHNHHVCTLNPTELTIRNQDRIFRSWKPVRIFFAFLKEILILPLKDNRTHLFVKHK